MSASKKSATKTMEFFSAKDLDKLDPQAGGPEYSDVEINYLNKADEEVFLITSALLRPHIKPSAFDFEDCGMHLGVFEFAPGLVVPLHSHPDNCIYYVERGSVIMGNREIGPGEGFLTRKDQPYGLVVGPNGLRLVEFTTGPRTALTLHERYVGRWKERVEKAVAKLEAA